MLASSLNVTSDPLAGIADCLIRVLQEPLQPAPRPVEHHHFVEGAGGVGGGELVSILVPRAGAVAIEVDPIRICLVEPFDGLYIAFMVDHDDAKIHTASKMMTSTTIGTATHSARLITRCPSVMVKSNTLPSVVAERCSWPGYGSVSIPHRRQVSRLRDTVRQTQQREASDDPD